MSNTTMEDLLITKEPICAHMATIDANLYGDFFDLAL